MQLRFIFITVNHISKITFHLALFMNFKQKQTEE